MKSDLVWLNKINSNELFKFHIQFTFYIWYFFSYFPLRTSIIKFVYDLIKSTKCVNYIPTKVTKWFFFARNHRKITLLIDLAHYWVLNFAWISSFHECLMSVKERNILFHEIFFFTWSTNNIHPVRNFIINWKIIETPRWILSKEKKIVLLTGIFLKAFSSLLLTFLYFEHIFPYQHGKEEIVSVEETLLVTTWAVYNVIDRGNIEYTMK